MAKRWTEEEETAWIRFFRGEVAEAPTGREIEAARRRFEIPDISKVHPTSLHAMAVVAARFLSRVPYRGAGHHTRFIEVVQILALKPDAVVGAGFPEDVLKEAVVAARHAIHHAPAPVELEDAHV